MQTKERPVAENLMNNDDNVSCYISLKRVCA